MSNSELEVILMDIKSPKSEPAKSFEKPNIEKAEKQEIAPKPDDKSKLKNKIERSKIDIQKEPKNKIQREKIDLNTPARNKIERPKIDLHKEPRNKIQREKIDLSTPARNKIERIPTSEPIKTVKPEVNQLSLEEIKQEITKINWKNISQNWNISVSPNQHINSKNVSLNPTIYNSKENPLYKHKQWLKTVLKNQTWKLDDKKLGKICGVDYKTIWRWRKKFNIPTTNQPRRRSINDGTQKDCRRCNQTKSIKEFEMYMSYANNIAKTRFESYCKSCRLEYKQVRALTNKSNIIRNIYGGKFGEKCPDCNTTIAKLPAFDFHHPNKELKTGRMNFHGNWKNTLKRLEWEKAVPSCRNCHLEKQSKFYNKYKELIDRKNKFESSLEGIEAKLYNQIYKKYPGIGHKEGHQIKSWMSKRIVVERLYNGGCIGCDEKNLSTLQFHHRDKEKKTFQKYDRLRYTTLEKIEKKLIQDDTVCLCGNCHRMITSKYYEKNHQEIIGSKYSLDVTKYFKNLKESIDNHEFPAKILKQYPFIKDEKVEIGIRKQVHYKLEPNEKRIKKEIMEFNWKSISQNWKLPSGEVLDPTKESSRTNPLYKHKNWFKTVYNNNDWGLSETKIARITNTSSTSINYWRNKLQIPLKNSSLLKTKHGGEVWKKYLYHISELKREGKRIQTKALAESVGVNPSTTRKNIRNLADKGLIKINGEHTNRAIILTEKGKKESERYKKE